MEIQILHSILHSELRPWKLESGKKKEIIEALIQADEKTPGTLMENITLVKRLVSPFADLVKSPCLRHMQQDRPLLSLPYQAELEEYYDHYTRYYKVLIASECTRIYNRFLDFTNGYERMGSRAADLLLKKIRVLALEVTMKNKKVQKDPTSSDLDFFVLRQLKSQLVALYFSIQDLFREHLDLRVSLKGFYALVLPGETGDIPAMKKIRVTKPQNSKKKFPKKVAETAAILGFGFKGDRKKLRYVIHQLCKEINLLDQTKCTVDDLVDALLSKGFIPGSKTFMLGCYTKLFSYLIERLQVYFDGLTYSSVENSCLFISRNEKAITANCLSTSLSKSTKPPKQAAVVEAILKGLR